MAFLVVQEVLLALVASQEYPVVQKALLALVASQA
jgi:hypothetical protein